jgi:hypothetical protein
LRAGRDGLKRGYKSGDSSMMALAAIAAFVIAILLLNVIEFGRPD